ncbi:MAG: hypothetical protein K6E98_05175 [Lachnospiraceae bacterium]|nr:hypothetical protein [Lachnospiraceae bacterium]
MTIDAYINPDFTLEQKMIFLLMNIAGVLLCVFIIMGGAVISVSGVDKKNRKRYLYDKVGNRVQRFYEMIISATSVMAFSCAYIICNHIYSLLKDKAGSVEYIKFSGFISVWEGWKDFVLLLLICLSCVLNTILDKLIIPLKFINKEEKATVRMLAMFYVIFILFYLNVIGDESEYSPVMLYYLGLMVGRFVYFDASFGDFIKAIINVFKNFYLLAFGLLITGILCYFGFSNGYLLERNYYLIGAFYTHLFMLVAVFIIHHSHILYLFIRKPKDYDTRVSEGNNEYVSGEDDIYEEDGYKNAGYEEEYEDYDEEYEEYDNYEYDEYE